MEYISSEEFLKQPKEVHKVFIDWWKPSAGDLISFKVCIDLNSAEDEEVIYALKDEGDKPNKLKDIPLFTEGQLRKFIEDKTKCHVDISYTNDKYELNICKEYGRWIDKYSERDNNLLQAYWKVAIEVAKE